MGRKSIEYRDPATLTPYENNPRDNDASVPRVKASIQEFHFQSPILVDPDGVVIAGHTRLKAALELGLAEVPVVVVDDLTPEQVRAYRLADNKAGEASEWLDAMLAEELAMIEGIDMSEFGFDVPEVEDADLDGFGMGMGDGSEDEVPEVDEVEPTVKRGQVWRLGEHRLMCGDSTSKEDVDRLMQGERAEMCFTDPPWNVNYGADDNPKYKKRQILNDSMPDDQFHRFFEIVFTNLKNVMWGGGMLYCVMASEYWGMVMEVLEKVGMHWSSTLIWVKDQFCLSRKDYHTRYEPIWYGWESSEARRHPLDDRTQDDVWEFDRPRVSVEHPMMKPVALVCRALSNSSNRGDIVVDLFGGSGTTLIACEQTQRRCRMMELDPRYCDVIIARWEKATGRKAELMEGS